MSNEKQSLPGMSEAEWKFREGRALTQEGAETGDLEMTRKGIEIGAEALREALRPSLEERFANFFPGEPIPEYIQELGYRVKEKEIDLAIEEEGGIN